jgi:GNAT superfamily N-acetyltransferase
VFTLVDAGAPVGQLALAVITDPPTVRLADLWVRPEARRLGHGRAAMDWAQQWAPQHADQLVVAGRGGDPAQDALFGHIETRALWMLKPLTPHDSGPLTATGRAMRPEEFAPWRAAQEAGYVSDIVGSGITSRADAESIASKQFDELLPDGLATENHTFLCIEAGGEVVATNWLLHHYGPATSFVFGVEVVPAHRGKGYGRVAMQLGERATLRAGDSQLGLNVFGQNATAIGLYGSMGYGVVEKIRSLKFGS